MLLAIDIGNTNIVIGVYHQDEWIYHWRVHTDQNYMADEYAVLFFHLFHEVGLSFEDFDKVVLSSVVPPLNHVFLGMLEARCHCPILVVNHELDTGLSIQVDPPDTLGGDLIANSVAAYNWFQSNCLAVDFGTATTVMAIKAPGYLLGGSVCAGLTTTANALATGASKLTQVAMDPPQNVIGNGTTQAMQSGLILGHISMVEGLVARMKHELGDPQAKVVATGGLSQRIVDLTDCFDRVAPWLTLDGLRLIAQRN